MPIFIIKTPCPTMILFWEEKNQGMDSTDGPLPSSTPGRRMVGDRKYFSAFL